MTDIFKKEAVPVQPCVVCGGPLLIEEIRARHNSHAVCPGEKPKCGCGAVLTEEEVEFYETSCNTCEEKSMHTDCGDCGKELSLEEMQTVGDTILCHKCHGTFILKEFDSWLAVFRKKHPEVAEKWIDGKK